MRMVEIILTIILFIFIITSIRLILRNRKLIRDMAQLIVDKNNMADGIERLSLMVNNGTNVENGFIKFLSESRDSAFNYIEDVQHAIFVLKEKYENKEDIRQSITELFEMLPDNKEK